MSNEAIDRIWNILGKKLSGEISVEEQEELAQLIRIHPELYYAVQHVLNAWTKGNIEDDKDGKEALKRHLDRLENSNASIRGSEKKVYEGPFKTASSFLVRYLLTAVFVFGMVVYCKRNLSKKEKFAVTNADMEGHDNVLVTAKAGTHSKIVLPDGSVVWVNAASSIEYDKKMGQQPQREVFLNGEAFFDVVKNPQKPFVVHTRKVDIKVVGTMFNVKSYAEDGYTTASLIKGSIDVFLSGRFTEKITIKPLEKITIPDDIDKLETASLVSSTLPNKEKAQLSNISYLAQDSSIIETSWMDNRLVARNSKFIDLSKDIQRRYSVLFRFGDKDLEQLVFDANFKKETLEEVLQALQMANFFNYSIQQNTVVINK